MTALATVRPDGWNLALFFHLLGGMLLVGAAVLAAAALFSASRSGSVAAARLGYRSLLLGVIPAWIAMRVSAEWIADKEGLNVDDPPSWVEIGYVTSEPTLLLLIAATVLSGLYVRGAGAAETGVGGRPRIAAVLVALTLVAYLVAIWAMTTKPV